MGKEANGAGISRYAAMTLDHCGGLGNSILDFTRPVMIM